MQKVVQAQIHWLDRLKSDFQTEQYMKQTHIFNLEKWMLCDDDDVIIHNNIITDVTLLATLTVLNDCMTWLAKVKQPRKMTFIHPWFISESFTLKLRVRLSGGHSRRVIDVIDLSSDPRLILLTFDPLATRVNSQDKETSLGSWWSGEINHSGGSQLWMIRSRTSSTIPVPGLT